MKINLIINPSHHWQQSVAHGLALCQLMREQNHQVVSVFFYGEAAHIAADLTWQKHWAELNEPTQLLICRTMIETFGIDVQTTGSFKVVGMGTLAINMEQADRTVELN